MRPTTRFDLFLPELEYEDRANKEGLYWYPLALKEYCLRPFYLSPEESVML